MILRSADVRRRPDRCPRAGARLGGVKRVHACSSWTTTPPSPRWSAATWTGHAPRDHADGAGRRGGPRPRPRPHARHATRQGAELRLAVGEFHLPVYFLRHPGGAASREELMHEVWAGSSATCRPSPFMCAACATSSRTPRRAPAPGRHRAGVGCRFDAARRTGRPPGALAGAGRPARSAAVAGVSRVGPGRPRVRPDHVPGDPGALPGAGQPARSAAVANPAIPSAKPTRGRHPSSSRNRREDAVMWRTSPSR